MESRCDLPMRSKSSGLMMFDVMAAMCAGNRGIGWKGGLPWPPLRKDYEYYTTVTSTHMKVGRGKIVHLHGRHSWASCSDHQKAREGVYHVVISRTMDNSIVPHESLLKVVGSFEESLVFIDELAETECVDSVWIMGGSHLYQESLAHPRCRKLYLTHVNTDFQSDTYFPEFENGFKEIPNDVSDITRHEENGVSFDFKLYERMSS